MQLAAMALRIAIEGSAEFPYAFKDDYAAAFKPTTSKKSAPADKPKKVKEQDKAQADAEALKKLFDELRRFEQVKKTEPWEYDIRYGAAPAPRAMWAGGGSGTPGVGLGVSSQGAASGGHCVGGAGGAYSYNGAAETDRLVAETLAKAKAAAAVSKKIAAKTDGALTVDKDPAPPTGDDALSATLDIIGGLFGAIADNIPDLDIDFS
ncbi:hypothetical protein CcrJ4_gp080 [Caulobacter phage J4]|nr:hypothetical protein CcrJ4_gp080 [Caulobacter phage J4]